MRIALPDVASVFALWTVVRRWSFIRPSFPPNVKRGERERQTTDDGHTSRVFISSSSSSSSFSFIELGFEPPKDGPTDDSFFAFRLVPSVVCVASIFTTVSARRIALLSTSSYDDDDENDDEVQQPRPTIAKGGKVPFGVDVGARSSLICIWQPPPPLPSCCRRRLAYFLNNWLSDLTVLRRSVATIKEASLSLGSRPCEQAYMLYLFCFNFSKFTGGQGRGGEENSIQRLRNVQFWHPARTECKQQDNRRLCVVERIVTTKIDGWWSLMWALFCRRRRRRAESRWTMTYL